MGLESGQLFKEKLEEVTFDLDCTEILVFYTDGITEAMNLTLEEFGEERLLDNLRVKKGENVIQMREHLLKSLNQFLDGAPLHDDITMVLVKCNQ